MALKDIKIDCFNKNQKLIINNRNDNIHFTILDGMRNQIVEFECDKSDIDIAWTVVKEKKI